MAKGGFPSGGKRKGGLVSTAISLAVLIIMAGGIMAVLKINDIHNTEDLYSFFKKKSEDVKDCYANKGEGCIVLPEVKSGSETDIDEGKLSDNELGYNGPSEGEAYLQDAAKTSKEYTLALLDKIKISKSSKAKLVISDWSYFAPVSDNNPCWTSKDEVLDSQAVPGSVKYKDINHNETDDKEKACSISKGKWIDPYSGKTIKNVKDMDVDFIIPLSVVNKSGGSDWDKVTKKTYSNDTENVLIAVSKDSKDDRGDKTIAKYIPKSKEYKCEFAKNYTIVANKYNILITDKDKDKLSDLIVECEK